MAFNGSGSYSAPAADFPAVASTLIESTKWNNVINDIATALSTCVTKDGQTTPTANIPMAGYRFTGLGAGTANGHSVRYEEFTARTTIATRQVLTTGTGATYTTPAGCRQIRVRAAGGGGGGGGQGGAGGTGGTTTFNSVNAVGGGGGSYATSNAGIGGTGGTGTASFRAAGNGGDAVSLVNNATSGSGGGSAFFAGGGAGSTTTSRAGAANTGGGGNGGGGDTAVYGAHGGGGGECFELIINSPAATYTYTIGAGGTAGTQGTSYFAPGAGGTGVIVVDELY